MSSDLPARFPLGAAVSVADLEGDPHPHLARLRAAEPVSWLPSLGGWLVTSHAQAVRVMRDAAAFTVDDPRFSTARVVGPSMLSLDGPAHARHRDAFARPFRPARTRERFAAFAAAEAGRLAARSSRRDARNCAATWPGRWPSRSSPRRSDSPRWTPRPSGPGTGRSSTRCRR
ncbi:hypothetical protein [Actinomadura sp. CNU-125]|uniref:hypothetical protein n=1 Tax=Actinomadura sp. CNU-125 TaxID=1904961 RepID=UPI000AF45452|nr:hypothetical protein [Actinomadura sp. CNU-125]